MAWCSVVAKAPQESQESDENVHFFLQGFASCLPVIKTFFIGANAFDCMFLLLLRALVQARKDEKGCRMSKETRVSFVSSPGGWRAVGGLRFTPSSAVTAALLPVDRASPSLTQREARRTGSGCRSTIHLESQDLEELIIYLSFIFTFFPLPRKSDCFIKVSCRYERVSQPIDFAVPFY